MKAILWHAIAYAAGNLPTSVKNTILRKICA